jgi:hypothetical protein
MSIDASNVLFPAALSIYVGLSAAGVFWILTTYSSNVGAALVVRQSKGANGKVYDSLQLAKASFIQAFVQSLNVLAIYFQNLVSTLALSYVTVLICVVLFVLGFFMVNFQQEFIVAVDNMYESMYPVIIFPFKWCFNLVALILSIAVAILNFISQVTATVLLQTTQELISCPGYFDSFFRIFEHLALVVQAFVTSFINWTLGFFNNSSYVEMDIRTPISHIRLPVYDIMLRLQCACPADRGALDIVTTGLFDSTSTTIDDLVHYGVNSVLSVVSVMIKSLHNIGESGTYVAPDTDTIINLWVYLMAATEAVLNQATFNAVAFVEALITLAADFGTPLAGTAPWKMIPIWSIPFRGVIMGLEAFRIVVRCVVNAPSFFITSSYSSGHVTSAYKILNTTDLYLSALNVTDVTLGKCLGGLHHTINATGYTLASAANVGLAYMQFTSVLSQRLILGRDNANWFMLKQPYTGACLLNQQIVYASGFQNFWSALYDVQGEYNALVTTSYGTVADNIRNLLAPYYPPLGESLALGIIGGADYMEAIMSKFVYMLNALVLGQPPFIACLSSLDRQYRVSAMLFVESLGDLISFFLDIKGASEIRNAHFNCMETHVVNYMLIGSLKASYFAGKLCNTRYFDGTLVECDFGSNSSCPSYKLPYHELQTNLLCSTEDVVTTALKFALESYFVAHDFAQANFVQLIACAIAPLDPVACPKQNLNLLESIADAALAGCNAYTATVQLSNVLASLLSFGYIQAYNAGYTGRGYGPGQTIRGTTKSFNNLQMTGPDMLAFYQSRHT